MIGIVRFILLLVVFGVATTCGQLPKGYKIVNPFVCQPGTNFKLDCNDCVCSSAPGSIGMCTLLACGLGPDECIPDSYFGINEKLCPCPDSRVKWDSNCFAKEK